MNTLTPAWISSGLLQHRRAFFQSTLAQVFRSYGQSPDPLPRCGDYGVSHRRGDGWYGRLANQLRMAAAIDDGGHDALTRPRQSLCLGQYQHVFGCDGDTVVDRFAVQEIGKAATQHNLMLLVTVVEY